MSRLLDEAYHELFPDENKSYYFSLEYSGRFNGYNGNIRMRGPHITVTLSRQWELISDDIKKGIIQDLLARLFKVKRKTMSMDFYHTFLKSVHHTVEKTKSDPILRASFDRINARFFLGLMDAPNFVYGGSRRKMGSYEYGTDTIMISRILLHDLELLDYVMYHEMLHKHHKFSEGRHHTKEFKADEAKFGDTTALEARLSRLASRSVVRRSSNQSQPKSWWPFS